VYKITFLRQFETPNRIACILRVPRFAICEVQKKKQCRMISRKIQTSRFVRSGTRTTSVLKRESTWWNKQHLPTRYYGVRRGNEFDVIPGRTDGAPRETRPTRSCRFRGPDGSDGQGAFSATTQTAQHWGRRAFCGPGGPDGPHPIWFGGRGHCAPAEKGHATPRTVLCFARAAGKISIRFRGGDGRFFRRWPCYVG